MSPKPLLLTMACALLSICLFAQKKKKGELADLVMYKYGDVKPEEFAPAVYPIDSAATAIVIADVGNSQFTGNSNGGFSIEFKEQKRIRLLNKNSFTNEATVKIPLYFDGTGEERMVDFEAITYNIEAGKITTDKLSKNDLFAEKYNEHYKLYKFTFPNVREGSIIEYKYTISSPFIFMLQPWKFQKDIPVLWSEYQATIPSSVYDYLVIKKGYLPYVTDTTTYSRQNYYITYQHDANGTYNAAYNAETLTGHWAMKDIPALKEEPFTSCLEDFRSTVSFQLRHIVRPSYKEDVLGTWSQLADKLLKREDFGAALDKNNGWLSADIKSVTAAKMSNYEKAESIYEYVRDNYTCNENYGVFLSGTLKEVYQDKTGNVADINLLLTAAYRNAGFTAYPVILSTRSHGKVNDLTPLVDQYNYVICRLTLDGKSYLLDATRRFYGFGKLSPELYNFSARVIDDTLTHLILLSPDSLREINATSVFIVNDKDHKMMAAVSNTAGYIASDELRKKLSKESEAFYFKDLGTLYTGDVEMSDEAVDSLKLLSCPVKVNYHLKMKMSEDDILYFNPIIGKKERKNPFTAAERFYPVNMPYCSDESYVTDIEVPDGYAVDELPKSTRVKLNESDGLFEYLIATNGSHIQMRTHLKIDKTNYEPEDYQTLRDFYAYVVKKEAEQIVFKKIK